MAIRRNVMLWTAAIWIAYSLQTFVSAAADWTAIVGPAEKQVPRIEILREDSDRPAICSGIVINGEAGAALTAAHCVEHPAAEEISVTLNGRHAAVARANRLLDLAVIRFTVHGEKAITLAEKSPEMGTEVAIVGYPFGVAKYAAQYGRIAQRLNDETKTIWINADLIFGDSGGAVIDDQGRLVGMTSRIYSQGPAHMGAAIPIESIRDFVEPYLPVVKKP